MTVNESRSLLILNALSEGFEYPDAEYIVAQRTGIKSMRLQEMYDQFEVAKSALTSDQLQELYDQDV
jgi:hypothetical protein